MAESGKSVIGFVPSPETATTVVAWVQALADEDEETMFLRLETGFDGRTAQAVKSGPAPFEMGGRDLPGCGGHPANEDLNARVLAIWTVSCI